MRQYGVVGLFCILGAVLSSGCSGCDDPEVEGADMSVSEDMDTQIDMDGVDADTTPDPDLGSMADMTDAGDADLGEEVECQDDSVCLDGWSCGSTGVCKAVSCDDLNCETPAERCEQLDNGGAVCADNSCAIDADCAEDQYCDASSKLCLDDTCQASSSMCNDGSLSICATNGSGYEDPLSCPVGCGNGPTGEAVCVCSDDWDCPSFMRCEAGVCLGSGRPSECRLEPVPFNDARPELEASWGTKLTPDWPSPYPLFSNVAMTTMVANLNDDNLDGQINEFDFPEIIFVGGLIHQPFDGAVPSYSGVLRIIQGGGPNKGATSLAMCGDSVWRFGDDTDGAMDCDLSQGQHYRVFGGLAVGDLNNDGTPEIVTMVRDEPGGAGSFYVRVISPDGEVLAQSDEVSGKTDQVGALAIAVADVDGDGMGEVLVGSQLFEFSHSEAEGWSYDRTFTPDDDGLTIACVGDFIKASPGQEWIDGLAMWRKPSTPQGYSSVDDCVGGEQGEDLDWCEGNLVAVWDRRGDVLSQSGARWRGLCAAADVLGAQGAYPSSVSELDGKPEIVSVAEEELIIFDSESGELYVRQDFNTLMGGAPRDRSNGGAPNIDDFDGDGLPEVGSAFATRYIVADFQPTTVGQCEAWEAGDTRPAPSESCDPSTADACGDGRFCDTSGDSPMCRCLHNSWVKETEDNSSRRTGSSVFDFNGDGAAEVVYNDECFFRIYDGRDGSSLFVQPSEHVTNIEYPVIADVDNDGNAEIIFSSTSQGVRCSVRNDVDPETGAPYSDAYNTGIQIWGDGQDAWVSARRIWNQHAYSVTNVYEDARLPVTPVDHWSESTQGLLYNTFRSNPRSEGIAPDLVVSNVRLSSPQMGCGVVSTTMRITGTIENRGDLRVGAGVALIARGEWADGRTKILGDAQGKPLTFINTQSIEPLRSVRFELIYNALDDGETEPPVKVILEVDPDISALPELADLAIRSERECREDNNVTEVEVSQEALADLNLTSVTSDVSACPLLGVSVVVSNDGSAPVSGALVKLYAGDPDLGGRYLGEVEYSNVIAPGTQATIFADVDLQPLQLIGFFIQVYAVVSPLQGEDECNLSNNVMNDDMEVFCTEG